MIVMLTLSPRQHRQQFLPEPAHQDSKHRKDTRPRQNPITHLPHFGLICFSLKSNLNLREFLKRLVHRSLTRLFIHDPVQFFIHLSQHRKDVLPQHRLHYSDALTMLLLRHRLSPPTNGDTRKQSRNSTYNAEALPGAVRRGSPSIFGHGRRGAVSRPRPSTALSHCSVRKFLIAIGGTRRDIS